MEQGGSVENNDVLCTTMIGEIIAIGNELTSGRITNTTSAFAARELFRAGHEIYAMHTIGDTPKLIGEALKRAIRRVDFVIVTGGLGPTPIPASFLHHKWFRFIKEEP